MGTRANWFVDVEVDDAPLTPTADIAAVGVEVDLTATPEELERALAGTIREEGQLYERGITCELKLIPEMACSACPLRATDERRDLCDVGARQERLIARSHVLRHAADD